jgi:hypothetical protein
MSDISEIHRTECRKVTRLWVSIVVTWWVQGGERANPSSIFSFLDSELKRGEYKIEIIS